MNAIIAHAIFEAIRQNKFNRMILVDELLELFDHSRENEIFKIVDQIEALDTDYNK
jgi:hypothetical protein